MSKLSLTLNFEAINCASCGVTFAMTDDYINSRRDDHATFYCPNGHDNLYEGASETEQLRKQLVQAEHQRDSANLTARQVRQERDAVAKAHRKMRTRILKGVCPCCNRSFDDLRQHMATEHADFGKPQTLKALQQGEK